MGKDMPVIFMMFGIVVSALLMVSIASYYGADWTWIAQQYTSLILLFIVFGLAMITLVAWLKGR